VHNLSKTDEWTEGYIRGEHLTLVNDEEGMELTRQHQAMEAALSAAAQNMEGLMKLRKAMRALEAPLCPDWIMHRYGQFLEDHQHELREFTHVIEIEKVVAAINEDDHSVSMVKIPKHGPLRPKSPKKQLRRSSMMPIRKGNAFKVTHRQTHRRSVSEVSKPYM